jgi:uncharacterized protein YgiM (DUF1202 family)
MKKTIILLTALFMTIACAVPVPGNSFSASTTPSPAGDTGTPVGTTATVTDFQCVVTATNLNLRKEPGTNAMVDIVLNGGDVVTIDQSTPAQGNWQRVFYGDLVGWINTNYCK